MLLRYPNFSKEQVFHLIAMHRYRWIRRCQEKLSQQFQSSASNELMTEDIITGFVEVTDQDEEIRDLFGYWRRLLIGGLDAIQFSCDHKLYTILYTLANSDYTGYTGTSETTKDFLEKLHEAQPGVLKALENAPMADPEHLVVSPKTILPSGRETAILN